MGKRAIRDQIATPSPTGEAKAMVLPLYLLAVA